MGPHVYADVVKCVAVVSCVVRVVRMYVDEHNQHEDQLHHDVTTPCMYVGPRNSILPGACEGARESDPKVAVRNHNSSLAIIGPM